MEREHIARNMARFAERRVVPLIVNNLADANVGKYLTRLIDYLFAAARYAAKFEEKPEGVYKKPQ
ncbi:hypothetical protein BC830DRAFT_1165355 [Chytriomyces sp. MP71]|nr:hypothetical protein BC830DRAFT_1165355 [Chytriomyces sp. MP71]